MNQQVIQSTFAMLGRQAKMIITNKDIAFVLERYNPEIPDKRGHILEEAKKSGKSLNEWAINEILEAYEQYCQES